MNVLYDSFPDEVSIRGKSYRIETDFREWIRLQNLVKDNTVPSDCKIRLLMQWYKDRPDNVEEGLKALGTFLRAEGITAKGSDIEARQAEELTVHAAEPAFSYNEDAACIFCAFMECYGIDLESVRYMHWWKFRILFEGLNEDTEIKQRIRYRLMDISTIKDKEERNRIKRIKRAVALRTEHNPVNDFKIGDVFSQ